jgi:hypothetical protein
MAYSESNTLHCSSHWRVNADRENRQIPNDKSKLASQEAVDLPGEPSLAPWRVHIWITGIMATINTIRDFPLILDFGSAGKLDV